MNAWLLASTMRGASTIPHERLLMSPHSTDAGIAVCTTITGGALTSNHAEGVVVSTSLQAGALTSNHAEGVVVSTSLQAGALHSNHAEELVSR
jgi:hypothetical protein